MKSLTKFFSVLLAATATIGTAGAQVAAPATRASASLPHGHTLTAMGSRQVKHVARDDKLLAGLLVPVLIGVAATIAVVVVVTRNDSNG